MKWEELEMPANIETMFYVREKPWHGLGVKVQEAPTSADALVYAGPEQHKAYLEHETHRERHEPCS